MRGIHAHFVPICYAVLENKDTWFFAFIFGKLVADYGVIACILYFPMLIFSGTTLPFEVMPAAMQKIISMFPLTQGIQLMKATFLGLPIENVLLPVGFMGAVIFICFGISVKCFKWE